jgi:hypothetical protein
MEKQIAVMQKLKEHTQTVRYQNKGSEVVTDIYIAKSALGSPLPRAIKITIEEG